MLELHKTGEKMKIHPNILLFQFAFLVSMLFSGCIPLAMAPEGETIVIETDDSTQSVTHTAWGPLVADPGPNQIVTVVTYVYLDGSASYATSGTTLSFFWTQLSGSPIGVSGRNTPVAKFFAYIPGTYIFNLTVADGKGNTASANVMIEVVPFEQ